MCTGISGKKAHGFCYPTFILSRAPCDTFLFQNSVLEVKQSDDVITIKKS